MKVCSECKREKSLLEFNKRTISLDGLSYMCKKCSKDIQLAYYRTREGKLKQIYNTQVQKSKKRKHNPPTYTKKEFVNRYLNDKVYLEHYYWWKTSNYPKDLSPSFDRIDNHKGYSFDNLQVVYWKENNEKGWLDRKNGVIGTQHKKVEGVNLIDGSKISFFSVGEASRNGFLASGVSQCARGVIKFHKGYKWTYKK